MDLPEVDGSARDFLTYGTNSLRGSFLDSASSTGRGIETTLPRPERLVASPGTTLLSRSNSSPRRGSPAPAPRTNRSTPVHCIFGHPLNSSTFKSPQPERSLGRGERARDRAEEPPGPARGARGLVARGAGRSRRRPLARESSETPQRSEEARGHPLAGRSAGRGGIDPRRPRRGPHARSSGLHSGSSASSRARASARLLLSTSACSRSPSLSATMPAPAWNA